MKKTMMAQQENGGTARHCASYYAASAHPAPDHPRLEGDIKADVCIIGAGFTGIAAAYELAARGYDVVVLEAMRVGWGASGRNGGQIIGGISGEERLIKKLGPGIADTIWELRWSGHDIIRERVAKHAISCDLKWGYIDVALKPRHMTAFRAEYEALKAHGFPYEHRLVGRDEVRALLGTDRYIGGLINKGNGHLHPLNLCLGEAEAASGMGVRFFENSEVVDIRHGPRVQVCTRSGSVNAAFAVLAGNAYHRLERKALKGKLFPAGSYIIATEPLPDDIVRMINPQDLAVCDPNYVLDYFRLSADKRLLFGGRCNYSGRVPKSIKRALLPRMVRLYPRLKDVRIDYEWGGNIGIVVNRVPLLGRTAPNVFYAQGYSGHGVNVTHIAGRLLAEAISGTAERLDVFERIKHRPLPGSEWFGSHMVALGMLFFRLRDLL